MKTSSVMIRKDDLSNLLQKLVIDPLHIGSFSFLEDITLPLSFTVQCRIIIPFSGHLTLNFQNDSCPMERGDVIILPAHSAYSLSIRKNCSCAVLDYRMDETAPVMPLLDLYHPQFFRNLLDDRQLANTTHYVELASDDHPGFYLLIRDLIVRILIVAMLCRQEVTHTTFPTTSFSSSRNLFRACSEKILSEPPNSITVDALAEEFGYSKNHIYKVFIKEAGISPKEFIRRNALEKGVYLLRTTDRNIADISAELGFSSAGHFSSSFHEFYGITPTACRKGKGRRSSPYWKYAESAIDPNTTD